MSERAYLFNGVPFFAVIAMTTGILFLMGRIPWCSCGEPMIWTGDIWSSHMSQHLFDPYSFSHVLHGVVFYWLFRLILPHSNLRTLFLASIILESAWEIAENSPWMIERYRAATFSLGYTGDSIANSLADIFSCALGFAIAASQRWIVSVLLFLVIELTLLLCIRDNLTLNVMQLIAPSQTIKEWQLQGHGK